MVHFCYWFLITSKCCEGLFSDFSPLLLLLVVSTKVEPWTLVSCPVFAGSVGLRGRHSPPSHDMVFPALFHSRQPSGYPFSELQSGLGSRAGRPVRSSGVFVCDMCEATFTTSAGLRGHRDRVHLNKVAYTCQICQKGFTMRGHYIGHMNMHNKVKAFKCPSCPRAFAHRTSLRTHLRTSRCGFQAPTVEINIKSSSSSLLPPTWG